MGKTKGPYEPEYPEGTFVATADRVTLEQFLAEWRYHNKLQVEQLAFADHRARVKNVSFYHGADELYLLDGVPGVWHEQCLRPVKQ
jgi:hypothetical protein